MTSPQSAFPLRLTGELDPDVGRWQWLFKWLLAIPHFVVLVFVWIGFVVSTVVARLRDPLHRPLPPQNLRLQRRRPPLVVARRLVLLQRPRHRQVPAFSLADDPAYPARLEVEYPERLSRGRALAKWWLLAIPHYLIVAIFTGGAWSVWSDDGDGLLYASAGGLIGLLVLFARTCLLFTSRYPRPLHDLVLGLNHRSPLRESVRDDFRKVGEAARAGGGPLAKRLRPRRQNRSGSAPTA